MESDDRWPRSVGGHVALDFVNTDVFSQGDRSEDVLRSAADFLAWYEHAGLTSALPRSTELPGAQERSLLQDAATVRAAVRSIVEAIIRDEEPDREAMRQFRTAWADAIGAAEPALDDDRLTLQWDRAAPRAALWEITGAAADLLRLGATERLKACPACGFVFLDSTKNGRRRWCSMDDCGKQEKMQRYVAKRARGSRAAADAG